MHRVAVHRLGVRRLGVGALVVGALGLSGAEGAQAAAAPQRWVLAADRDDDDANGLADGAEPRPAALALTDAVVAPRALAGARLFAMAGGRRARIVSGGFVVPWGDVLPAGAVLQGLAPGVVNVVADRGGKQEPLVLEVHAAEFVDGQGARVDAARSHASLVRSAPSPPPGSAASTFDDDDELRVRIALPAPSGASVRTPNVTVESLTAAGTRLDELAPLTLASTPCPSDQAGLFCFASPPLRFVVDDVDRAHPLAAGRALRAEVGGAIVVREDGRKLTAIRVQGPRSSSIGPILRSRATVRAFVFRATPGGAPAIGGNDAGAVAALRSELSLAAAVWGQCGITFGDARALDVKVVDPPPSFLVAVGHDLGLPASGGEIRLRVEGKPVTVPTRAGQPASVVAYTLAMAIEQAGFAATLSPNARIGPAAHGSVDVLVRKRTGAPAVVEAAAPGAPLTTDPSLVVRIGSVDLTDGLQHFTDMDAVAGTLEERTLLKAVDDGDPRTIELFVVPAFAGGIRIGESFIGSDGSSLRNAVLLDRAGVRARRSSLTLAHELGHVLLDMPDHPDDYGVDTPVLLMDSDASDASAFGPRRLTAEECARTMRESGPQARVPLLEPWPLGPLRIKAITAPAGAPSPK